MPHPRDRGSSISALVHWPARRVSSRWSIPASSTHQIPLFANSTTRARRTVTASVWELIALRGSATAHPMAGSGEYHSSGGPKLPSRDAQPDHHDERLVSGHNGQRFADVSEEWICRRPCGAPHRWPRPRELCRARARRRRRRTTDRDAAERRRVDVEDDAPRLGNHHVRAGTGHDAAPGGGVGPRPWAEALAAHRKNASAAVRR